VTSLSLFVNIKLELARTRALPDVPDDAGESDNLAVLGLKAEVEKLRATVSRLEEDRPGRIPGDGINLTKRAQVLRMYRRGEPVPSIAAALETPPNEVALLLKVHSLTSEPEEKAG